MKVHNKRSVAVKKKQDSDPLKSEPGVNLVRCPHLKSCIFGEQKSKKARNRCRGVLCLVNHWESCLLVACKCSRLKKQFLMEIKGDEVRHIPGDSPEYHAVQPRLEPLPCNNCDHRVLDYYVVYGEAIVDVKCCHDGHLGSYPIK